jgi:hypothetical protein
MKNQVRGRRGIERNRRGLLGHTESLQDGAHSVTARRERREPVNPVATARRGPDALETRACRFDQDSWNRGTGGIADPPFDFSSCLSQRERTRNE